MSDGAKMPSSSSNSSGNGSKNETRTSFSYPSYEDEEESEEEDQEEEEDIEDGNLLEILIETLTGTSFQVRVSPWETGSGLKDLLHRTQGIPSCHQHILLGQHELLDESPLIDQGIQDGAVLKLILSMKGGPINSIRMPTHEDELWKEFATYMEMNREELWDAASGRQVTLLVLREGDDVNVYRVVENPDGTFSPLNESWGANSMISSKTDTSSEKDSKAQDEANMRQRLAEIRSQMETIHLRKQEKKKRKKNGPSRLASARVKPTLSIKGKKIRQNASNNKRKNNEREFSNLVEDPIEIKVLSPKRDMQPSSKSHPSVHPLKGLSEAPSSSSSIEITNRNAILSRPQSKMTDKPSAINSSRINVHRRCSRPNTQERGLNTSRLRGSKVLEEIPHSLPPIEVDFSRRKRLEAIRAQRERTNPLGPLNEDPTTVSSSDNENNFESYRKSLAKHTRPDTGEASKTDNSKQKEAWPRSEVPFPLYMNSVRPKRRHRGRRLYQSHNADTLRIPADFDDRPKTSPEILAQRPSSVSTSSTMSDRIQLRGPDDKLKEIISILNGSRSSLNSHGSPRNSNPPQNSFSKKLIQTTTKGVVNRSSQQTEKISLNMSFASLRGTSPPSTPIDRIEAIRKGTLKDSIRSYGVVPMSNKSTPDTSRGRKTCGLRGISSPNRFPLVNPKSKSKLQKPRCRECHRKLGLANTYSCRCGHIFCATHRYSETHECTFDYKSQGKKFLQLTNPLVVPPKLPKI